MERSLSNSTSATAGAGSQSAMADNLDSLLDFSEYDNTFQSPALSPLATSKASFTRPVKTESTTPSLLPQPQQMSGPSHQYEQYKQQTGIVPGALASTHEANQNNVHIQAYSSYGLDFMGFGNSDDMFDFNAPPTQASLNPSDVDMDFESPSTDSNNFFFEDSTINPSSIGGHEPTAIPSPVIPTPQVQRVWPGMHQQAAQAKAQAQAQAQRQQQLQQQQLLQQRRNAQCKQPQRPKTTPITDPLVEQRITQLLNTMRAKPSSPESGDNGTLMNLPRPKKDEDEMDEDERLLASDEGKKLSSKERRQLRNKVSARAFRSRRKEYITQLESEIALKVADNSDLRNQNQLLSAENKRLSDLTRMLLSSPSFSDFLENLSANPQQLPQASSAQQQQPQQQQQEPRQIPKDPNPYTSQFQHQQIGMAMIPEQPLDFSMLSINPADSFDFQPHVYAVLETPEPPTLDTSVLSGKTSNFVGDSFDSEEEKADMPVLEKAPALDEEAPAVETAEPTTLPPAVIDEEFENDPAFALYHDVARTGPSTEAAAPANEPVEIDPEAFSRVDIFGGIESDKALARFELVDHTEDEVAATFAMARVQRISASLESVMARLELLTVDL